MSPRFWVLFLAPVLLLHAPVGAGGCGSSCKEAGEPRVAIDWEAVEEVAPETPATGEATTTAEQESLRAEKPMMVFVRPYDPDDEQVAKIEAVVLKSEQVAIGSKFFLPLAIPERHADKDRLLKKTPDASPRFVFLKRDYTVHSVLKGKQITATKLLRAMRALARLEYETDFDKTIKAYGKLLNEKDRLLARQEALQKQRDKLAEDLTSPKARKLRKQEKELEAEFEAWDEAEAELVAFKFREARRKAAP